MHLFRARVHVSPEPLLIQHYVAKFKEAGLHVDAIGTEHIYLNIAGDDPTHVKVRLQDQLQAAFPENFWGWVPPSTSVLFRTREV